MADPSEITTYDVTCPHCRKAFTGELMGSGSARHRGFKCPHCRLFVPFARVDDQNLVERGT